MSGVCTSFSILANTANKLVMQGTDPLLWVRIAGYMALVCAPGLLLASRMYTLYKKEGSLPLPSLKKTLAAMVGVLLPRNLPAAAYSLLTLAFAGMSAMCLSATPGEVMKFYPGLHGERESGKRS